MKKYIISKVCPDCLNVDEEINSFMSTLVPDFNISTLEPDAKIGQYGLYKDFETFVSQLIYTIDLPAKNNRFIIRKSEARNKDNHNDMDAPLYVDVDFEVVELYSFNELT